MEKTKAQAIILDGDGTLWRGRVAAGIGKAYMIREALHGHFGTVKQGYVGAKKVKGIVVTAGADGESVGLAAFYGVLKETGLGTKEEMRKYALKYIRSHTVKEVEEFLSQNRDGVP